MQTKEQIAFLHGGAARVESHGEAGSAQTTHGAFVCEHVFMSSINSTQRGRARKRERERGRKGERERYRIPICL